MIPVPAQYLIRFDDLCPTMKWSRWEQLEALIKEFEIRPILAVVPDNLDPELILEDDHPEFWSRMRALEETGATIAMHGYCHVCASYDGGLLSLHRRTEFAGVAESTQRQWIHSGLELLRVHGLNPRLFVAPRHGFDRATLRALSAEGIRYLSDGFARVPHVRGGVTWIPQQLWSPQGKSAGLWTVCFHSNTTRDSVVAKLGEFLAAHHDQVTSFERVVKEYPTSSLPLKERIHEATALWRVRFARRRRKRAHSRG